MNSKLIVLIVVLIFIGSFVVGTWLSESRQSDDSMVKQNMLYTDCSPVMNTCTAMLLDTPVSLKFLQQPSALRPFEIEVQTGAASIDAVFMDFRMESMNMGVNLYRLNKVAEGVWKTSVILPVCTSRRSDWTGELQINYQGVLWTAVYTFTQAKDN